MGGVSQAAGKSIVVEVLKQVPVLAKKLDSCSKKTEKKHWKREKDFVLASAQKFGNSIKYHEVKYQQFSGISLEIQISSVWKKRTLYFK